MSSRWTWFFRPGRPDAVTEFPETSRRVLAVLDSSAEPLSGRRVARLASMSPTTCNAALADLAELGAVHATQQGRARRWSVTNAGRDMLAEGVARDALILTALPLEYAAVRDRLGAGSERRAPSGARYCEAVVRGKNIEWTVRLFETSVGSATAAAALGRAVGDFRPDLVVFSGVAGGLRPDDQHHGDVIIIERAYQGQGGKSYGDDGESKFKSRPKAALATEQMIQLARSIARAPAPLRPEYVIAVGDLATTEEVVADNRGPVSQRLTEQLNNCVAVDMETHGVYEAARQHGVPVVAVRGLSDIGGKKDPENDRNWQPVAAGNAATIALELLIRAHPDDLDSRGAGRGTPNGPTQAPGSDTSSRPLPPQVSAMLETLATESPTRADAARDDLTDAKATPRTVLSMLTTHPPAWLRQDRTGLAWGIVATAGDAVHTRSARTAWQQAAVIAEKGGDASAAAVFRLFAARSIVTEHDGVRDIVATVRKALTDIDLSGASALAPVVDFWRRAVGSNDVDVDLMPAARLALTGLGRADLLPKLSLGSAGDDSLPAADLPAWLNDRVVAEIMLVVCTGLLADDDYGRARVWANQTVELAPWSSEARLRQAQAMLGSTHDSLSIGAADAVTDELMRIESIALQIRRDRAAWGGRTDEALALAGRSRVEMDDPQGALALLLAPPRGTATANEADSPVVAQVSTVAALRTGDVDLAAKLADSVEQPIERHLLRAATFSQTSNTHDWARREYRSALELAEEPRQIGQALLGLARLRVPVTDDPVLADRLAELGRADPQGADLVRATVALVAGDAQTCLGYARRYRSLVAVELTSDALSTLGRTEEAFNVLDDYGTATGDLAVRMQALQLASRARLHERAVRLADTLIRSAGEGPLRRAAREARADIAARAGDWAEVEMQMRRLIDECSVTGEASPDDAVGQGGRAASTYIWAVAEAMYRQRKFTAALELLRREAIGSAVTDPQKVRLVLAVLHQLVTEHAHLIDDELIDWVLAIGSSLIKHEDIGASAVALVVRLPRSLSETQVHHSRSMLEAYFDAHGDDGTLRSLDVSPAGGDPEGEPDLTPLIEELRTSLQPKTSVLTDTTQMVLAGRIPTGFLALAAHRSYAEVLITRALGVVMARPATRSSDARAWLDPRRLAAAAAALDAGTVVVDTSALVLADAIADRRALIAAFAKVLLARSLYDDVYQARGNLAMRTTASMGWNATAGKPTLTEFDPQLVDRWARTAADLDDTLVLLSPVDDAPSRLTERASRTSEAADLPIASEATARRLGSALWADDVGLLRLADADDVPAFGTPELITALRQRGVAGLPSDLELLNRLRTERVVDLPLVHDWAGQARAERWAPESYVRLAMSRPKAWSDVADGFSEYQALVRAVCECIPEPAPDARVAAVLPWAEAACVGLGTRLTPDARPSVIGALIAWTALNTEPLLDVARRAASPAADASADCPISAPMLEALLELSVRMQAELFPAGEGVRAVVVALADTIRHVSDGSTAAAVLARAFSGLPEPLRNSAMSALLSTPAAPLDKRPKPSAPPSGRHGSPE